jgi:ATP-dependent exoDNAse (exonuclease V) alpha subunit
LIVIDEASLAGTFTLDELTAPARDAGAKVVLVGDWAQLTGIEAGGIFRALVADRDGAAPTLTDVRRFRSDWEKSSSVDLRAGREDSIDAYLAQHRVLDGSRSEMLDAVYQAWKTDTDAGMTSLMIAPDGATVAELNHRARAGRIAAGEVTADGHLVAVSRPPGSVIWSSPDTTTGTWPPELG